MSYEIYFDWQGQPIDMLAWTRLFEDDRSLGDERIGDARVSTVWLGLNHNWLPGPPLIFETLIFGGEHADWMRRYGSEREARDGHAAAVAWLRGEAPEPE